MCSTSDSTSQGLWLHPHRWPRTSLGAINQLAAHTLSPSNSFLSTAIILSEALSLSFLKLTFLNSTSTCPFESLLQVKATTPWLSKLALLCPSGRHPESFKLILSIFCYVSLSYFYLQYFWHQTVSTLQHQLAILQFNLILTLYTWN